VVFAGYIGPEPIPDRIEADKEHYPYNDGKKPLAAILPDHSRGRTGLCPGNFLSKPFLALSLG
jgi:hypothetical protein